MIVFVEVLLNDRKLCRFETVIVVFDCYFFSSSND
jgi:hypothetical protein